MNKYGSVRIMSLDAKDLWMANQAVASPNGGYSIRDQNGNIQLHKFINDLDYSLELIKLKEFYRRAYRKSDFSFVQRKTEYTQRVINVTFQYSVKEFNRVKSNVYIKYGYGIEQLHLDDNVCILNGELVAITVGKPVMHPISLEQLGKYFYLADGCYHAKQNIPTIFGVRQLREKLYKEGFWCDGSHYVRYKRSAGSSRVGKCLFLDEKLYSRIHRWEMCGIKVKSGQSIDLAALEAYIALPLSSIIGTITIQPENILVIDDYQSEFVDDVLSIHVEDGKLCADNASTRIKNSIFDGQGLISPDLMGEYEDKGFILLRNRFFKCACFNCNIQQWLSDHKITDISQLHGFTLAKSVEDIRLITTPSSIKYIKFGSLSEWMRQLDPTFGVVKHEKKTHFFDGRMVQLHYQLLNTLPLSQSEIDDLLQPSLEYLRLIKTDPAVLKYYLKYPQGEMTDTAALSKNDIVYKMLGINDDFSKTKLYHDFRQDLTRAFTRNLRYGHILVNGNYSTLLGNPIEMLQRAIGTFHGISQLGLGNVHTIRFPYNTMLLGSRSPHVCSSNNWLPVNCANEEIDRYFHLTDEIVCINSIGESVLDRLSGADFDSDTVLLTDHPVLIQSAQRYYNYFKVPVNRLPARKLKRKYTIEEKVDLDVKTSVNKIGEIINLSQELNTLFWDKVNTGSSIDQLNTLYNDIAKLDILSNIEIDKAKKEYSIDSTKELKLIKERYEVIDKEGRKIKPNFFGHVARKKGYYDSSKKKYQFHHTSMDFLQHRVNQFRLPIDRSHFLPFSDLLKTEGFTITKPRYESVNRVIDLVREMKRQICYLWQSDAEGLSKEEKSRMCDDIRQSCIDVLSRMRLSANTMYWLLNSIESEKCKDISSFIFSTLFATSHQSFYNLIKNNQLPQEILIEDLNGKIKIFDFSFSKTYKRQL